MDPTLTPQLNPWFSLTFLALVVVFLVVEVIGITRKQPGDTFTEAWRWVEFQLPAWTAWLFRILTGGVLVWAILHFLAGAP